MLAEPDDVAAGQSEGGEDVGYQAHVWLEHRLPRDGADHGDDGIGQQNHGAQEGAALEREVEQQGHGRTEHQFQGDRKSGEEEGLAEGSPPFRAAQGGDVVLQTDEPREACSADAVLVQGEPDRVANGDRRHQGHDDQGGGGHADRQPPLGPVAAVHSATGNKCLIGHV
ncbi:hypothetical protein D9M69_602050 [compost metagenome]